MPEPETEDQLEQWPVVSRIVTGQEWLHTKVGYLRWVGDPEKLKSIMGIIEENTKRPFATSQAPYEIKVIGHDWFNWQPVMRISTLEIQNIVDGNLSLKDLILE